MSSIWDTKVFEKYRLEAEAANTKLEVVDGIFVCSKCGSKKVMSFSKQTKSGDESLSVFAMCSICKNKWVI